jgi:hypothetical protein
VCDVAGAGNGLRKLLNGHEGGNAGHRAKRSLEEGEVNVS